MSQEDYSKALNQVPGLSDMVDNQNLTEGEDEKLMCMDFVLEGLHQFSLISKEIGSQHRPRDHCRQHGDLESVRDRLMAIHRHIY